MQLKRARVDGSTLKSTILLDLIRSLSDEDAAVILKALETKALRHDSECSRLKRRKMKAMEEEAGKLCLEKLKEAGLDISALRFDPTICPSGLIGDMEMVSVCLHLKKRMCQKKHKFCVTVGSFKMCTRTNLVYDLLHHNRTTVIQASYGGMGALPTTPTRDERLGYMHAIQHALDAIPDLASTLYQEYKTNE